jgi:hypothetical protein
MFFPSVPTSRRRTTWRHDPSVDDRCHVANSLRQGAISVPDAIPCAIGDRRSCEIPGSLDRTQPTRWPGGSTDIEEAVATEHWQCRARCIPGRADVPRSAKEPSE